MIKFLSLIALCFFLTLANCGGSGGSPGDDDDDDDNNDTDDTINTEKLIGTPFEGEETGDSFQMMTFICNQYRTEIINSFPIQVFVAFFTFSEETTIQEGLDIANDAIGFTAYELTDTWSDDIRIIYKVADITAVQEDSDIFAGGYAQTSDFFFNSKVFAERQSADWIIALEPGAITKWMVAHELGHATGIFSHDRIDYDLNTTGDLEENSLMGADAGGSNPALNDYNEMMQMQGQIMQDHLGEEGSLISGSCDE